MRLVRNIRYLFLIYCRTKIIIELNFHSRYQQQKNAKKKKQKKKIMKSIVQNIMIFVIFLLLFPGKVRAIQPWNKIYQKSAIIPYKHLVNIDYIMQGVHNEIFFTYQTDYNICLFQYKRHRSYFSSFPFDVTLILSSKSFSISVGAEEAREEGRMKRYRSKGEV